MDKDRDLNEKGPEGGKDNQSWQDKDSGRSDKEHAKPVQLDKEQEKSPKEQEKSPRPGGGGQQGGQHGQPSPANR